ncbi:MAG TPA: hypothetical protein PKD55_06045 [Bellilinea sp.]|nr:hypothetical protein [Bellilinea sp.]
MKNELFLKYVGAFTENDSEIPLSDLGKSLASFERLVAELVKICRVNGEVVVTATVSREGSHVVDTIIHINNVAGQLPFDVPEYFIQFLKMAGDESWRQVAEHFKDLNNIREGLNSYVADHPVDIGVITWLITKLINKARNHKRSPFVEDKELPARVAKELYGLIKRNGFKGFVSPIINESVGEIEISPDREFRAGSAKINEGNFEDYLTEDNEILPDFVNGVEVVLDGEITSVKGTRGDSLTFQYIESGTVYNLELFPPAGKNTKHYVQFYKERVRVTAIVERTSMYKKPKLHLSDIEQAQATLNFE